MENFSISPIHRQDQVHDMVFKAPIPFTPESSWHLRILFQIYPKPNWSVDYLANIHYPLLSWHICLCWCSCLGFPFSFLFSFNHSQDPAYLSSQVNKHSLIQMDQNGQSSLPPVNTLDVIHLSFIFSPVLKWPIILCISKCSLTAQTSSTGMLFISHTGHIQSGYFC